MVKYYQMLLFIVIIGLAFFVSACTSSNDLSGSTPPPSGGGSSSQGSSNSSFGLTGKAAPDFKLKTLDGKEISLSQLKGKPVVVNFFASWCPPCIKEMPDLNAFANEYKDKVTVLGLNVTTNDRVEDVKKMVAEQKLTFPVLLDEKGAAAVAYKIVPIPTTFFIDKDGVIQDVLIGAARDKEDFARRVAPLLK